MNPDPGALVTVTGAMAHYESRRTRYRADSSLTRIEAINRAMFDLWLELLAPYRVYSESNTQDGVIRWHVVLDYNDKNYGTVTPLWMMRGAHRERDAVRLSLILRNQFVLGASQGRTSFPWHWPDEGAAERRGWLIQYLNNSHPDPPNPEGE